MGYILWGGLTPFEVHPCRQRNVLSQGAVDEIAFGEHRLDALHAVSSRVTMLCGKQICSKCEQCAKVDPHIAVISVPKRSTLCNRLQFSHVAGPTKLKSAVNSKCSMPDPRKHPSGIYRVQFKVWASVCSKLPECKTTLESMRGRPGPAGPVGWLCLQQFLFGAWSSILQTPCAQIVCTLGLEPS